MQIFSDTPDEVNAASRLPRLREFETECRRKNPIPSLSDVTAKDRCRLKLYEEKMRGFGPYLPFSKERIAILHSDVVGLLAARKVFQAHLDCLVLLTGPELAAWHNTGGQIVVRWCWYFGWRIHTTVSPRFQALLGKGYPVPSGCEYWLFTSSLGPSASHELWRYEGHDVTVVQPLFEKCCEEGPIDEWHE